MTNALCECVSGAWSAAVTLMMRTGLLACCEETDIVTAAWRVWGYRGALFCQDIVVGGGVCTLLCAVHAGLAWPAVLPAGGAPQCECEHVLCTRCTLHAMVSEIEAPMGCISVLWTCAVQCIAQSTDVHWHTMCALA